FVVYVIASQQRLAVDLARTGIVNNGEEVGQNAALERRSKLTTNPRRASDFRPHAKDVRRYQALEERSATVASEQNWPVVLVFHQGCVAQLFKCADKLQSIFAQLFRTGKFRGIRNRVCMAAINTHTVSSLRSAAEPQDVGRVPVTGDRTFGVDEVTIQHN